MSGAQPVSRTRSMLLIGRGVLIELTRKREFYVMLILMGIYFLGVLVTSIVGIENAATATFILNLGMTVSWFVVHLLALLLVARQIPEEIERRTLYPLLARPLERSTLILAKWASTTVCGFGCLVLLLFLAWIPVPKLEAYDAVLLCQLVALGLVSVGMLAAIGMLMSLISPRGIVIVVSGLIFLFGDKLANMINAGVEEKEAASVVKWLTLYIPDFDKINLITRYTDGVPHLEPSVFAAAALYGVIFIFASLGISIFLFERRAL